MKLIYVANAKRQCGRCHGKMIWNCGAVGSTAHPIQCLSCTSQKFHSSWGFVIEWMKAADEAVYPAPPPPSYDDDIPF